MIKIKLIIDEDTLSPTDIPPLAMVDSISTVKTMPTNIGAQCFFRNKLIIPKIYKLAPIAVAMPPGVLILDKADKSWPMLFRARKSIKMTRII